MEVFGLRDYFDHSPIVPLRQFPPHGFETEFGQTPFRSAIPDCFLLEPYPFTRPKRFHITLFVFGTVDPVRITATLHFEFQKSIYIIDE